MKTFFYASCLVALLAGAAHSGSIAYDGIEYPIGVLNLNGPASGFSAPWSSDTGVNVVATGLTNSLAITPKGGSVSGFFDFIDPLTNTITPIAGKEFWASFLLYHSGPNDQSYMGLGPAGAVLGSLPSVAIGVRLGQYGVFEGATFTASGVAYTANGSTDFLVAHFKAGGAVWDVDLFVNKGNFTVPDLSTTVAPVTYGTMVNHNQAQFGSDEFRLGDTSEDVAAGATPALGATWGGIKAQYR